MNELREKLIEALAHDCFDRRFGPGSWDRREYYRDKYLETAAADLDHLLDILSEHREEWKEAAQEAWLYRWGDVEQVTAEQVAISHIEALRAREEVAVSKLAE
jgi:hypothetical protein